jgi:hypothetical protein
MGPQGASTPRAYDVVPAPVGPRVELDAAGAEQGLAQLVLTLVELVRQVLEHQAIARMDTGSLSEQQVEEMGMALMRLDEKMDDLCKSFGVERSALQLSLGPLGDLL